MSTFRCPVMTIPPPQPGPSGSSSPGVLPSSSLPSPNTPGPEFQINLTDTNACTQLYALMRTHSDVHEEGQACAETHRRSPGGKQTHWTSLKNTGPHSQTHGLGEREVQREPAAQRATVVHPEMTAANAPICTERDTPSHCHGHVHGARTPRASGHTCTQTRVMHTYRGTRARTRLGNLYRDARRLCETVTHRETLALGVHTHIHTPPGTPFFPLLTPFPPFPSPLTSLGQSHPSSFRSKSASSQGGERCQCAFSPPPPRRSLPDYSVLLCLPLVLVPGTVSGFSLSATPWLYSDITVQPLPLSSSDITTRLCTRSPTSFSSSVIVWGPLP